MCRLRMIYFLAMKVKWFVIKTKLEYANEVYIHLDRICTTACAGVAADFVNTVGLIGPIGSEDFSPLSQGNL